MAWRSVVITQPARLKLEQKALRVEQDIGSVRIPLEDIAVIVIDQPQVTLTACLLTACAAAHIAVITVDATHTPNGVLLPFLPHSRAVQIMRKQLAMSQPRRKQLWRDIVQRKLDNQAEVLAWQGHDAAHRRLLTLAKSVRSGDAGHAESQGAQIYFRHLFGPGFNRNQDRLHNAALNYGYSIIRSALARSLVGYGFLPAFGLCTTPASKTPSIWPMISSNLSVRFSMPIFWPIRRPARRSAHSIAKIKPNWLACSTEMYYYSNLMARHTAARYSPPLSVS